MNKARKRNWRGQFVKNLRDTPEGSREWLIWSHYHGAWHRRSEVGGACGYASDIASAGLFEREIADSYNDGDRNEAFHVSEKADRIRDALRALEAKRDTLLALSRAAHSRDTRRMAETGTGSGRSPSGAKMLQTNPKDSA